VWFSGNTPRVFHDYFKFELTVYPSGCLDGANQLSFGGRIVDASARNSLCPSATSCDESPQLSTPPPDSRVQGERLLSQTGAKLSMRESEVLYWAARGKTMGETAVILSLSEHSIHSYVRQALQKLNAVNVTQGVFLALKQGILF
jgi:DNA-binding CsgD family transcriptional regulator